MVGDQTDKRRERYARLASISKQLREGARVGPVTVRELLRWFDAERRNDQTNFEISEMLRYLDLRTEPWFEDQYTDGPLEFQTGYFGGTHQPSEIEKLILDATDARPRKKVGETVTNGEVNYLNSLWWRLIQRRVEAWIYEQPDGEVTQEQVQAKVDTLTALGGLEQFSEEEIRQEIYFMNLEHLEAEPEKINGTVEVPARPISAADSLETAKIIPFPPTPKTIPETTFRIRRLECANRPPVRIEPNRSIVEAITTMLLHDFSQLPVMSGEREVKGVVSVKSLLECLTRGANLSGEVREYMDTRPFEISIDTPLLDAIGEIVQHQYALIRDKGKITGIVTISDLAGQFRQLSEPFLVLHQIENHVRALIQARISDDKLNDLNKSADFESTQREVKSVFDLDFGDYLRLLRDGENWARLGLVIDKGVFNRELDRIREIRNDVMHFDPDGIASEQLRALQEFEKLLRTLEG